MNVNFTEKQKFTQWWLWVILIGIVLIPAYGIYKQIIKNEIFGDNPASNLELIIIAISLLGLIYFFWYMTLITKIDLNGIKIYFKPFHKKSVTWNEIKSAKVVKYGFLGYGIRFGSKYGTVYNIKGNKGLAIELQSGKKFLIGTQKENELNNIIDKMPIGNNE
jgi:hypothetical protein